MSAPLDLISLVPGARFAQAHERYAGAAVVACLAGGRTAAASAYLDTIDPELEDAIRGALPTHVWAPCSACGEGILVDAPPVPQKVRPALKDDDGPRCRITWTTKTVGTLTTTERCPGRHYPLHGPWEASHPLRDAEDAPGPLW